MCSRWNAPWLELASEPFACGAEGADHNGPASTPPCSGTAGGHTTIDPREHGGTPGPTGRRGDKVAAAATRSRQATCKRLLIAFSLRRRVGPPAARDRLGLKWGDVD